MYARTTISRVLLHVDKRCKSSIDNKSNNVSTLALLRSLAVQISSQDSIGLVGQSKGKEGWPRLVGIKQVIEYRSDKRKRFRMHLRGDMYMVICSIGGFQSQKQAILAPTRYPIREFRLSKSPGGACVYLVGTTLKRGISHLIKHTSVHISQRNIHGFVVDI